MQILRDYQEVGEYKIRVCVRSGYRRVLYVLPTGGGKTTVAASIIRQARAKGSKILFLAHRKELIEQCSARLDGLGVDHGIIMADHPRSKPWLPVQVGSIQTIGRRGLPWEPDLVFVDECHRIKGETYLRVIADCGRAVLIGITATPCRTDGKGLSPPFETMVLGPSVKQLTQRGYLCPVVAYRRKRPDLSGVSITAGDYQADELQEAMCKPELVGDAVAEWKRRAAGRSTVVFATGIKHSKLVRDQYLAAGISAEHLDGSISKEERAAILGRIERGETLVLVNCGVCVEGWDCPRISCVQVLVPTMSLSKWLQMPGRGGRIFPGKENYILLDHGGNHWRFGSVDADREWTLDGEASRPKGKRVKDVADMVKVCPDCDRVAELTDEKCPCGYVFKAKRKPLKTVDGELELVTEAKPITEEGKRRRFEWFLTQQYDHKKKNGDPHAPNFAVMKFRSIYHESPKRGWREAWLEKRQAKEETMRIESALSDRSFGGFMRGYAKSDFPMKSQDVVELHGYLYEVNGDIDDYSFRDAFFAWQGHDTEESMRHTLDDPDRAFGGMDGGRANQFRTAFQEFSYFLGGPHA